MLVIFHNMLVICLLTSLFCLTARSQHLLLQPYQVDNFKVIQCLIDILNKYFSEEYKLTYVEIGYYDNELLKALHTTLLFSLIYRQPNQKVATPNKAYLISSNDVTSFTDNFHYLLREGTWNPHARFLIVIKILRDDELHLIFDELLIHHVNNVVVVNGTEDGNLYTYNSFNNYACGKYYDDIISFGLCSQTSSNLYPDKLITGLRKCNFTVSLSHRPPHSIDPLKTEDKKTILGTEEYIITTLGKAEQFTVNFMYNYDAEEYSVVSPNMTVFGPMRMLQNGDCDISLGGLSLVSSRIKAFSYLYGYLDYVDELWFVVKRSALVPTWRYFYLEFKIDVWALLFLSYVIYSIVIIILLQSKRKGTIFLQFFDNLLQHGHEIRTRCSVRLILIIWIWFTYLINTFYVSNLFSLTTEPSLDYQISNEEDIIKYNLKPCFGHGLKKYLLSENKDYHHQKDSHWQIQDNECQNANKSIYRIINNKHMYTFIQSYVYLYNEGKYMNKWGESLVYCFDKPYTKFLFGIYFYKGFPMTQTLQLNALRMRESGLAEKRLRDHYFKQKLKNKFSEKELEARFVFPWLILIPGYFIAVFVFILEISLPLSF